MNQNPITRLNAALSAERGALVNFVALLEREQGMLVENRTDQLHELSEKKIADARSLKELAEARRSLLQKNLPQLGAAHASGRTAQENPPPDAHPSGGLGADAIHAWLGAHSQEGLVVWKEILALAKRAEQLNHTNGELIQMKLRNNQQSLTVLSNAVNKANLYGPDGQPSFSPGSGRTLGSG